MQENRITDFLAWGVGLFGSEALNPEERLMRFFEEAAELAQAGGMSRRVVDIILDRVYARPDWNVRKEIGQAQACLEMYAHVIGESSDDLAEKEWQRVQTIPREDWERRHAAKIELGMATKQAIRESPR